MKAKKTLRNIVLGLSFLATLQTDKKITETETKISEHITHTTEIYNDTKYNIIKINHDDIKNYSFEIKNFETPKYIKETIDDAIIGINASLFREDRLIGLIRNNNINLNPNEHIKGSGYLVMNNYNTQILQEMPDTNKYNLILQSYPLLLKEGQTTNLNNKKSFRLAIALDYENNLYFVSTQNNILSKRITLNEFSNFFKEKDFKDALNLDGGKSLQIYSNTFKQKGIRKIRNAVYIKTKQQK